MASPFLTNQFLIAMPSLADPNFARGVTFMCQHNAEGAMGLMINRALELTLADVFAQMNIANPIDEVAAAPVFFGGPVQTDRGFVLHDIGREWESSFAVNEELAVTTSRDILAAMARGEGPRRALVALGYAGWTAGQLDQEMLDNAWLTADARAHLIFDTPIDQRWEAAARLVGFDPARLSGYAGHA